MGKALRPIRVDGLQLRWRFDGRLVIIPAGRSSPQLVVDWNWQDWLEPEGPGEEPSVVTPRFVAAAVRFALAHGWQPSSSGSRPLRVGFQDGSFTLAAQSTGQSRDPHREDATN